jgi:hypothetical protein
MLIPPMLTGAPRGSNCISTLWPPLACPSLGRRTVPTLQLSWPRAPSAPCQPLLKLVLGLLLPQLPEPMLLPWPLLVSKWAWLALASPLVFWRCKSGSLSSTAILVARLIPVLRWGLYLFGRSLSPLLCCAPLLGWVLLGSSLLRGLLPAAPPRAS